MKLTHPDSKQVVETNSPGAYLSQGWREQTPDAPAGNASLEVWQSFAREKGFSDDDLDGKTRDDLRAALS